MTTLRLSLCCCLLLTVPPAVSQAASTAAPASTPTDEAGFTPIFDGRTLSGWEGDPTYWRVENGNLVGEVTPATLLKQNSFIIWRGGTTRDFELKLQYRITARGNSGINYRSAEIAGQPFALRGYQADLDGQDRNKPPLRHTGQNYEEKGRTFLARRGEIVRVDASAKPVVIGSVGTSEALAATLKRDDWNEVHLIARGHVLTHLFNGRVLSIVVDDDAANRTTDGLLGVQVHVGPPMKVEFRHIRLKQL
ncbi:3-keto-disaccharide hydrolase [Horticoccus sp. 23ND18S-11]|uniref:3-keto-disaccharide hydrolase n=1 Tax=Horticoccus sp. 23ND18S-11 TaxID=3391832 RepID=UPI0039C957CF